MNPTPIRAAVIGCGLRAASYFSNLPAALRDRVQLVALADPSVHNREAFARAFAHVLHGQAPRFYDDGAALLVSEEPQALVIGSPNHAHFADAHVAMTRRIPTLLEKPVAISVAECRDLWRAWKSAGEPHVSVGFVLRYTPFYQRVAELVRTGEMGQIFTLDADENIGTATTRQLRGGWRRHASQSGGLMVEKCSHDFDVLRLLAGSEAKSVFSFAARTHFVSDSPHALRRFQQLPIQTETLDYGDAATRALFTEDIGGSLYEIGGDLPDHQSVVIQWESGVTTCFTAMFAQPRTTRRLRIMGSGGSLEGDAELSHVTVEIANEEGLECVRRRFDIAHDTTGHHGGDGAIAAEFWNAAVAPENCRPPQAGLWEGIEAVLIGLAAQQSAESGMAVSASALRHTVFEVGG